MLSLNAPSPSVAGTVFRASSPVVNAPAGEACASGANAKRSPRYSKSETVDKRKLKTFLDKTRLTDEIYRQKAADILRANDVRSAASVTCCGTKPSFGSGSVSLKLNTETGRASFSGLFRCGNVWACPICAKRIARMRCEELNTALAAARGEGLSVYLLTFTFRHHVRMDLKTILGAMTKAKQRLGQRAEWRKLPLIGSISATEVTHGGNGFHPHVHQIVFLSGDPAGHAKLLKRIGSAWRRSLQAFGLEGGKAAYQWQDGSAAGDYVAKGWQAAEELTLGSDKYGRKAGSRTPAQLLADAAEGCQRSAMLWAEYARAFHGKRQLVWSRGLKARFKIGETSDAEAAEAAEAAENTEVATKVLRTFSPAEWKLVASRKLAILRAAERGACLNRAMFGPSDLDRWRRYAFRDADPVFHA